MNRFPTSIDSPAMAASFGTDEGPVKPPSAKDSFPSTAARPPHAGLSQN